MRLLASLATAVAVYLAAGVFTGYTTVIRRRRAARRDLSRYDLWLVQAGSDLSPLQFLAASGVLGLVTLAVTTVVTAAWWLALMPAMVMAFAPYAFYTRRRWERLRQIRKAWPDALRDALAAISAGSTLTLALSDLGERGPAPLRPVFGRFRLMARMMGVVRALEMMKEELGDPGSDRILEVLVLAYEHGGGLVTEVLRDLIGEITEDLRLEAEIRADGTEQRIESWVVVLIPWLLLLFLTQTSDQYRDFYRSGSGLVVVLAAVVWSLIGVALLRYIGRSTDEPRVLAGGADVRGGWR
ncbi:MAG: hypothetical protein F4X18_11165 [Acidimicrobiia bacterium]|nr:type II secretion system F family protein [bacterium]MYC86051.1 hypothetical protein [Acidimicrobiia bacterium]